MAIKKNSHAYRIQQRFKENEQRILKQLQITPTEYRMMIFESGMLFLEGIYGKQEATHIASNTHYKFWPYWLDQWTNDDDQFLLSHHSFGKEKYLANKIDIIYPKRDYEEV